MTDGESLDSQGPVWEHRVQEWGRVSHRVRSRWEHTTEVGPPVAPEVQGHLEQVFHKMKLGFLMKLKIH